jgi:hypothetical protein
MQHAWRYLAPALLGMLLSGSFSAMAGEKSAAVTAAGQKAWLGDAVASLSAMHDTDALLTAGVLARQLPDGRARSIELLDRAVASAPKAVDIGLLDVTVCNGQAGCDGLKRETRIRRVDPRNGNLWMVALQDASTRANQAEVDNVLVRMAQSTSFDLHFISLARRFLDALKRIPPPPGTAASGDSLRQVQAMSLVMAFVLPPMQHLVEACKPGDSVHEARRKTCRAIADPLRRSDSLIANMIGLRLQELSAGDTADRQEALALRRRLLWKMRQLNELSGKADMPPASQIGIMLAHENEIDGIDALLRTSGFPLDPPANWQPPQPVSAPK